MEYITYLTFNSMTMEYKYIWRRLPTTDVLMCPGHLSISFRRGIGIHCSTCSMRMVDDHQMT